jgi:formamidopyrimidine-DNA glycosylase
VPELPEVEIARRCLESWAGGHRIQKVEVHERRVVAGKGPRALAALVGARFISFDRRGKHLLITLQQDRRPVGLWSHLGMTGKWLLRGVGGKQKEPEPRWSRVALTLDRGVQLHFVDLRLFGRLRVVPGAAFGDQAVLTALGPDPLRDGIDIARLGQRLGRSSKPIKPLLLDQGLLAGVGNILASEALFRARIDPRRPARDLSPAEIKKLGSSIRAAIDFTLDRFAKQVAASGGRDIRYVEEADTGAPSGVRAAGVVFNPFKVYDRAGEPCPRCRKATAASSPGPATIQRLVQAGRSTYYCPRCQS